MAHRLPAPRWLDAFMLAVSAGEESDDRDEQFNDTDYFDKIREYLMFLDSYFHFR